MSNAFTPRSQGLPVIKGANSNTLSDAYRDRIAIAYQYIGSRPASTAFELGGKSYETPIMAGPIGLHGKGDGLVEYARGVTEAGSLLWSHFHDPEEWDAAMKAGYAGLRVIKPLGDLARVIDEIHRDEDRGARGYAMDIDHGLTAYGDWDGQENAFRARTLEELCRLNEASPLPFYLKGVLSPHDARMAAEAGVAGIVLSGHNNRFPCAVPPLKQLPEIRTLVGARMKIFVDGGMNTGYDVFKALALGADGVLCARTLAGAFIQEGAEGLTYRIRELTAELRGAMANTGSPDLAHINRDCLVML